MPRGSRPKSTPELTAEKRAWCEAETVRLLPWIKGLAMRSKLPIPLEDLIQIGAMAVFQALPRFDPANGVKVESWLYRRVNGSFLDYARSHGRMTSGGGRTGRREQIHSLESVAFHDGEMGRDVTFRELLEDPHAEDPAEPSIDDVIETASTGCSRQERQVIRLLYARSQTQEQASKSMSLSPARVSQLQTSAFRRLREHRAAAVREACA